MSIEARVEELTAAITRLTAVLENKEAPMQAFPAPPAAPVVPVVPAVPVVAPVSPSIMPPPPAFVTSVPAAPVAGVAPFTDAKGLIDYVMTKYKALGADKGAKIQGVLVGMGYQNINDVKPEHYGALFAGVEAIV